MFQYRFFVTWCLFLLSCATFSQILLSGRVMSGDTHEPIIGATVRIDGSPGVTVATDSSGRFSIKATAGTQLHISYIGYKMLTATLSADGVYELRPDVHALGEVVVTAQEGRSLHTSSVIQRHAMEHLQPSSFADLLELLPGGRSFDPNLVEPNTIHLREATPSTNRDYATSALGTQFVIDGAPISTNANMQYLGGSSELQATSRDFTNSGVDMRTLSTDDIESVEVIRGIPSVEYGDLTSGLIKIRRKQGGHGLTARFKADMSSKLFYLGKDMEWANGTTLNVSADYLLASADPRNTLENYSRVTLSARAGRRWQHGLYTMNLRGSVDYTGSFDREKVDPDLNYGQVDRYKSSYNRVAVSSSFDLRRRAHEGWFRSLAIQFAGSYEHALLSRTRLVQNSRTTTAALSTTEGESDGIILPYSYTATQDVDGKPLNLFVKVSATFRVPSQVLTNSTLTGMSWNMDKNDGGGQIFDPLHPLYPGTATRLRKLSVVPANHTLSAFAEERLGMKVGKSRLEMVAGLRATEMLNLPSSYLMHGRIYLDPRANIGLTLPQFRIGSQPATLRLTFGIGQHTKNPTMDQLFPSPLYLDIAELNYYHPREDYRRVRLMTYVIDTTNQQLHPARNLKWEVGADWDIGRNRISVDYFRENMTSGFREMVTYAPYQYKRYDTSAINAEALTSQPDISQLPYTTVQELFGHYSTGNGSQTLKQGIEYQITTQRWQAMHTRLTIAGAWFLTTYRNSQVVMERPGTVIDNRQIQYVGIYKDNDGVTNEQANTNFTFDTDIPKLRLGFSLSAQCVWFTSSQRKALSNTPDAYMDPQGVVHDWQSGDENDIYLKWLVRTHTDSEYQRNTVPFAMNLNFKVTKRLMADHITIAMFCNRIWDYTPDYESRGFTIRRHVRPYFGLEMNFKI